MFRHISLLVIVCAGLMTTGSARADDLLRLWGLDADDSQLFAIDDVNNPQGTFNDFGPLQITEGHTARPIEGDIRAFTIVNTFDAYAVVNADVGEHAGPVLVHVDLEDIEVGIPVVVDVIGSIGSAGWDRSWTVTGIAGDPLYNVMYLLSADGDPTTNDRLTRVHADVDRVIHSEPMGEITWRYGGVRMGADITLGPAGLLLVADEEEGRVVMVDPSSGEVRGVRLEGLRVDTDTAQYAGIAWDGYNDRTALFDRRTGQLIVDDRANNSIVAFDLSSAGVVDAEGLEFVFRPTPPGEGGGASSSSIRGVNNTASRGRYGSRRGQMAGGGSGGGSGSSPRDFADQLDDPTDDVDEADDSTDDLDDAFEDESGDGPVDDPIDDDPFDEPPADDEIVVPVPGAVVVIGMGLGISIRRRRR